MLVVPRPVDENLDIIQTAVVVHVHIGDKLGGDLHGIMIDHRPYCREFGIRHATIVWKWFFICQSYNIYTYKLTNCTNKLRNASTRVNNYIFITTLDKR